MRYKSTDGLGNGSYKEAGHFHKKNVRKQYSPLARRFQNLEDEETGWGGNISQLMGVYRKLHDGTYCIDDIRKTDLTKLSKYPKTTFPVGPLALAEPIEGLEEGQYCLFNWRFTFRRRVNPCEIEVDQSKPIVFVNAKEFIMAVMDMEDRTEPDAMDQEGQPDVSVQLYDLLHEADKYCERQVDAQFYLTDKYLSFQHTGRSLSQEAVFRLIGVDTGVVDEADGNVMYHSKGLREFLLSNRHTIIVSNGFTLRFDSDGGRLRVAWLEKSELPRDIKISLSRNKRFTETVILPFDGKDGVAQNNYKVGLQCVFDDAQNIAFFANIGKVTVKIKGGRAKTLDRKDWLVSKEYKTCSPKFARTGLPNKKKACAIFACLHKGNVLIGEEESPVFCLMPTASSFGFPFLMQLDVHINKTNYAIKLRDAWNTTYAEIAGRLFAQWITDLTHQAEFTPQSIYGIVPKFEECISQHPEDEEYIRLFQKGFKYVIVNESNIKKPRRDDEGKVYVIDTNVFVNCPDVVSKMGQKDTVILSAKVIDELDNLKYTIGPKELRNVQKALKEINVAIDEGKVRMEMSNISLLPRDFDRHNPDNNILSVVLRHKLESPTLLTNDNGLQIKAKAIGINVIGLKDFLGGLKDFQGGKRKGRK